MSTHHYYPFGMEWDTPAQDHLGNDLGQSGVDSRYTYNGKEFQGDLGINLHYYGFRMYDPAIGRFTSVDPIADMNHHQSGFAYADNNPIKFIDFMGLTSAYNWDTGRYEDENGNEVSWNDVKSEYGISTNSSNSDYLISLGGNYPQLAVLFGLQKVRRLGTDKSRQIADNQEEHDRNDLGFYTTDAEVSNYLENNLDAIFDWSGLDQNFKPGDFTGGGWTQSPTSYVYYDGRYTESEIAIMIETNPKIELGRFQQLEVRDNKRTTYYINLKGQDGDKLVNLISIRFGQRKQFEAWKRELGL